MNTEEKTYFRTKRTDTFWKVIIPLTLIQRVVVFFLSYMGIYIPLPLALVINIITIFFFLSLYILTCFYWAMYKGRNKWFMLLGLVGLLGFIPLALIKDKSGVVEQPATETTEST